MKRLIDTSVLIDHLRGKSDAVTLMVDAAERGDALWSVAVVRTEVLAGMRRGEEASTRALLGALQWQDVTVDLADRAGELATQYLRSHPGVDTVDFLIAAATDLLDAELWTLNTKHFPMFPDLEPPY